MIAFGVSPAFILHLWVLQGTGRGFGWLFALAYAVCMALRLARFNARIDAEDQPHKSAGFLTGVPAPAGRGADAAAGPALAGERPAMDLAARLSAGRALGGALSAFLLISSVATFSLGSLRLRRSVRLEAIAVIALVGGALFTAPWETLSVDRPRSTSLMIPFSMMSYARVKRQRASTRRPRRLPVPDAVPAGRRRTPRKAATIAAQCAFRVNSRIAASATSRPKKKTIESR